MKTKNLNEIKLLMDWVIKTGDLKRESTQTWPPLRGMKKGGQQRERQRKGSQGVSMHCGDEEKPTTGDDGLDRRRKGVQGTDSKGPLVDDERSYVIVVNGKKRKMITCSTRSHVWSHSWKSSETESGCSPPFFVKNRLRNASKTFAKHADAATAHIVILTLLFKLQFLHISSNFLRVKIETRTLSLSSLA